MTQHVAHRASDRIAELEAENAKLLAALDHARNTSWWIAETVKVTSENAALREALRLVSKAWHGPAWQDDIARIMPDVHRALGDLA